MAAPAAGLAALGLDAKTATEASKGIIRAITTGLEHPVVSLHWEPDPKNYKKLKLTGVDVKITTGLILGSVALALLWEAANWFAQALSSSPAGSGAAILDVTGLVTANPVLIALADILGNPIKDSNGQQKTVTAPATAGAAYNVFIRNTILAGPSPIAAALMNQIANATTK